MSGSPHVPILSEVVPQAFKHGGSYLIRFEPDSLWYETSLAITAQALRQGTRTEYHTFQHYPNEIRDALSRLGLDLHKLEGDSMFKILDTYTPLTKLPLQPENLRHSNYLFKQSDYAVNDPSYLDRFTEVMVKAINEGVPEVDRKWLHVDDNTTVFHRYFKEEDLLSIFQTRIIPYIRLTERIMLNSLIVGAIPESFSKQMEAQCDGVLDFHGHEEGGQIEQHVRVMSMKGRACDTRWRRLRLLENGEVNVDPRPVDENTEAKPLGLGAWLKGPKKK